TKVWGELRPVTLLNSKKVICNFNFLVLVPKDGEGLRPVTFLNSKTVICIYNFLVLVPKDGESYVLLPF
ncbi:MAG: hypothetical protein WAO60_07180, partial [Defluviitoga tunisiensis]